MSGPSHKKARDPARPGAVWARAAAAIDTRMGAGLLLAALMLLSLAGKLANRFGFFVYPDSYYYLLQAMSMSTGSKTLGRGGLPFPPPGYASMKVTYPLAVTALLKLGVQPESAGRAITVGAAVLSVLAAYWAVRRLLGDKRPALLGAALVALSYGTTYWAGFVLSDSISVLLGFALVAMLARERPDEMGNAGDLATGAVMALLLLSRPTYVVALPMLVWLGMRRFGWSGRRLATAAVCSALIVSVVAFLYFPPAGFSAGVLGRLAPVIAAALAVSLLALLVLRRRAGATTVADAGSTAYILLAAIVPALGLLAWLLSRFGGVERVVGLSNFALRDTPVLLALVPGAIALRRERRADIGVASMLGGVVLLAVYMWVEPRESRYLTHLLPFLVPVASAAAWLLPGASQEPASDIGLPRRAARVALAVLLAFAFAWQLNTTFNRDLPACLSTSYPREVARGLRPLVHEDEMLLSAMPWPYHFHLGNPAWGAGVALSSRFAEYVPADTGLVVIDDAPLRLHYPVLAEALEASAMTEVGRFDVPVRYQYGYASMPDDRPVVVYRVTVAELQSALAARGVPLDDPGLVAPKGDQPD